MDLHLSWIYCREPIRHWDPVYAFARPDCSAHSRFPRICSPVPSAQPAGSNFLFARRFQLPGGPCNRLSMALMLGLSPWYAPSGRASDALAGTVVYAAPALSFGNTLDAVGIAACYGAAAYLLRGPLQIDLRLRRRRDVVRYVLVSATAAGVATIIGVACLVG